MEKSISESIITIRGQKVMVDADLARLYGVKTKEFNQAVKRNSDRFPADFMFRLTKNESEVLRSQFVTSKLRFQIGISKTENRGGRTYLPYVFTEYGVAMLSSVLNSKQAIQVNIEIMRTFGKIRQLAAAHGDLIDRLNAMEKKYDERFRVVFEAIRALLQPTIPKEEAEPNERVPLGFQTHHRK